MSVKKREIDKKKREKFYRYCLFQKVEKNELAWRS